MSFLDKFPNWDVFQEREVPLVAEMLSPSTEIVALLQSRFEDLRVAQNASDEMRATGFEALAQQAVFVMQLESSLAMYKTKFEEANLNKVYRALRIGKDQMLTALQDAGLEIIIPLGKSFDEVVENVNVLGWRHNEDFTEEVVVEVLEPIVLAQGVLIRRGCVIMGAPLIQKPSEITMLSSELK